MSQYSKLRQLLRSFDEKLANTAERFWGAAEPIHGFQNRKDNFTENGRNHVTAVEHNIWRLLTKDGSTTDIIKTLFKDPGYSIFLLSGTVCSHDFGKAKNLPAGFKHDKGSAGILLVNEQFFGLRSTETQAIMNVIQIHDRKGREFFKALKNLPKEKAGPTGVYNLRLLAVLLKAADILHLDNTRVQTLPILVDPNKLKPKHRIKFLSRSATSGWRQEGKWIEIDVMSRNPDEEWAINESFNYIQNVEWIGIRDDFMLVDLPYELRLNKEEIPNSDKKDPDGKAGRHSRASTSPSVEHLPSQSVDTGESRMAEDYKKVSGPSLSKLSLVGIGAITSPIRHWRNHMWVFWETKDRKSYIEYRAFYPLINHLPDTEPLESWRDFLCSGSIPGAIFRDFHAQFLKRVKRNVDVETSWDIDDTQLHNIYLRCFLPAGVDFVQSGRYSFCTSFLDSDDSASWAMDCVKDLIDHDSPSPAHMALAKLFAGMILGRDIESK